MRSLLKSGFRRLTQNTEAPRGNSRPKGDRKATVIAVATQKGGVGKTTTSVNLASALARFHGQKVLLLDLDPQGHVATALKSQIRVGGGPLSEVLVDERSELDLTDIVVGTDVENLHVTPHDPGLAQAEDLLGTRIGKEFILRDALETARTWYDVIVIDCPPNLGNLSLNGLVCADRVLVPCDPSPLAVHGVHALVETISKVAGRLNPDIDVMGILLTRVDGRNTALNQAIVDEITKAYGDAVLPVEIGINSALAKAQHTGTDVFAFDESSRGARQYRDLAGLVFEEISAEAEAD